MNIYITDDLVNFYNKYTKNYDLVKYILFNQLKFDISYIKYINRYYLYIIENGWIYLNKQIINDDFGFTDKFLFYDSILFEYFEKDLYYVEINDKYKITSECYKLILSLIKSEKTMILNTLYNSIKNICLNINNIITYIEKSYIETDKNNVIYILTSINYDPNNCYKIGGSLSKKYSDNTVYRNNKYRSYEDKYYYKHLQYVRNYKIVKKELFKLIKNHRYNRLHCIYRINFIYLIDILHQIILYYDR